MRNGDCPLGGLSTAHRGARSSKHALNASIVISDPNFDLFQSLRSNFFRSVISSARLLAFDVYLDTKSCVYINSIQEYADIVVMNIFINGLSCAWKCAVIIDD